MPTVAGPGDPRQPLVVIDPGHGGVDRGAVSADQADEKTLALDLARALRDDLVATRRVRVALTRDADRLVTLEERATIASRLKADLFVSIHVGDASAAEGAGLGIFTAGDHASELAAEHRAGAENDVDRASGRVLGNRPAAVDWRASPLSPRQVGDRSAVFANLVLRAGRGRLRLQPSPRKQAPLVLLAAVAAPAVLVEAGSMARPDDVTALASSAGRSGFARTLAQAIAIYFSRLPPER